jgi:hypothetical protein
MPAPDEYRAGVKSKDPIQYTIRQVPAHLDRSLRRRSKESGQSLNETAIEALSRGLGLSETPPHYRDLNALAGTWQEDAAFDAAITAQDQVDVRLWK